MFHKKNGFICEIDNSLSNDMSVRVWLDQNAHCNFSYQWIQIDFQLHTEIILYATTL